MDSEENNPSPLDGYVEVTMERLIHAHLDDALGQLRRAGAEPLRLFLAARSVHLALVTGLSAALSGTDGVGALRDRERRQWLAFYDQGRDGSRNAPSTYMASFSELLERAKNAPVGYVSEPLALSDDQQAAVDKLTALRHWTEHPRPDWHYIEPAWIKGALTVGLQLAETFMGYVAHRYEPEDEEAIRALLLELDAEVRAI